MSIGGSIIGGGGGGGGGEGDSPGSQEGGGLRRRGLVRSMTRTLSRILTPEDLEDWRAEHDWRTRVFMTCDHMYYSYYAWLYGFVMCVITIVSCCAFVLSTMMSFHYQPKHCSNPICTPDTPGAKCVNVVCYPEVCMYVCK